MSRQPRKICSKIFGAASALLRLRILSTLHTQGPLSYSEIMNLLNLSPSRDAGKFAYHLRNVLQANLVDVDKETKKYRLTSLGRTIVEFSRGLEEYALREYGKLLVRTSRLAIEDFDRNKIVQSLVREAGVPTALAQKIAGEIEERLLKLETIYLTAPLIREFVNAVLIEKGLQEYRHKLTRLGLPVYDVTRLIEEAGKSSLNVEVVHRKAGDNIMREYMLLNLLPRKIADAYLSGALHISNEGSWILKPWEVQHDLRVFLQSGIMFERLGLPISGLGSPKNLEEALSIILAAANFCSAEVVGEQVFSYFNVFLAPYVRNLTRNHVTEALRRFLVNLNQVPMSRGFQAEVTLGLDFSVPSHFKNIKVVGSNTENPIFYGDCEEEVRLILDSLFDIMLEDGYTTLFSPHIALNIRADTLRSKNSEVLLLKAHRLAVKYGTPYFINLTHKWQNHANYTANGTRLAADWTKDWEVDTMRTGSLDNIIINLPRIAYEAHGNENRFFDLLNARLEMINAAFKIKYETIEQRMRQGLLPFLSHETTGECYFRIKNASCPIGFVGLNEATEAHTDNALYADKSSLNFAIKIVKHIVSETNKFSQKTGIRVTVSQVSNSEAAARLAELDVDKYGLAIVHTQGRKELPYYTDLMVTPLESKLSLEDRVMIESEFHRLTTGGHLLNVLLDEPEQDPEKALAMTKKLCQKYKLGAFTYTRYLVYCKNCHKTFGGFLQTCPKCKSSKLTHYTRQSAKYMPLEWWIRAKKSTVNNRFRYIL